MPNRVDCSSFTRSHRECLAATAVHRPEAEAEFKFVRSIASLSAQALKARDRRTEKIIVSQHDNRNRGAVKSPNHVELEPFPR